MFPRWSPDGKEIIFTTFFYGNPDLVFNFTGRKKLQAGILEAGP